MNLYNIEDIIKKGYIYTNIVQLDLVLIRDVHVPILTNFFYMDRNQIKKIYQTYAFNFFSLLQIKKKINKIKNEKKLKKIMPLLYDKMYDSFIFEHQKINQFLNKSILFKDILFSVYKNEDFSRIEFNNNTFLPAVIVKDTEFLLNNLLPLTYFKNLLYTPKIIPEFTTEKGYKKITESYILDQWNKKMNYNKLIIHALINKKYLNQNILNIEIKKIFSKLNKKIKNYMINFSNNSSYILRTSYKRKNYVNVNLFNTINKKKLTKYNFLLKYRKNFVKKKKSKSYFIRNQKKN